jgi:hypothetical protein
MENSGLICQRNSRKTEPRNPQLISKKTPAKMKKKSILINGKSFWENQSKENFASFSPRPFCQRKDFLHIRQQDFPSIKVSTLQAL